MMAVERTWRGWRLDEAEDAGLRETWHALRVGPATIAADINGDGFEDVIDLTGLASRPAIGFVIQGDAASDTAGNAVSSAGDVNGDGFDDVVVGADGRGNGAGAAYVIFGQAGGFGTVDLSNLAGAGFIIQGTGPGTLLGRIRPPFRK